jgi:hypothetical protein
MVRAKSQAFSGKAINLQTARTAIAASVELPRPARKKDEHERTP